MPSPILTTLITGATTAMAGLASATAGAQAKLADLVSNLTIRRLVKLGEALKKSFTGIFTEDINPTQMLSKFLPIIGQTRAAFQLIEGTVKKLSASTVGAVQQIEDGVRQAATTISSAVDIQMKGTGEVISDTLKELELIEPKLREIQQNLIKEAPKLVGVTTQDLLTTYNQVAIQFGQLAGQIRDDAEKTLEGAGLAGADEFELMEGITKNLASAMKVVGLSQREINQEVRALFTGDIDVNARLARQLNITRAQILEQKAQGTLAAFILKKTQDIANANDRYNKSLGNTFSILKDVADSFGRSLGGPLFEQLQESLFGLRQMFEGDKGLSKLLNEMGVALGSDIAETIDDVVDSFEDFFSMLQTEGTLDNLRGGLKNTAAIIGDVLKATVDFGTLMLAAVNPIADVVEEVTMAFQGWGKTMSQIRGEIKTSTDGIKGEVISLKNEVKDPSFFGEIRKKINEFILDPANFEGADYGDEAQEWLKERFGLNDLAEFQKILNSTLEGNSKEMVRLGNQAAKLAKQFNELGEVGTPEFDRAKLEELYGQLDQLSARQKEAQEDFVRNSEHTMQRIRDFGGLMTEENRNQLETNHRLIVNNMMAQGNLALEMTTKLIESADATEMSEEAKAKALENVAVQYANQKKALEAVDEARKKVRSAKTEEELRVAVTQLTAAENGLNAEIEKSIGLAKRQGQNFGVIQKGLQDMGTNAEQAQGFLAKLFEGITKDGQDAVTVLKSLKGAIGDVNTASAAIDFFDPEQVQRAKDAGQDVRTTIDIIEAAAQQTKGFTISQRVEAARAFKDIEGENLKTIKAQNKARQEQINLEEKTGQISAETAKARKTGLKIAEDEEAIEQNRVKLVAQRAVIDSNTDEKRAAVVKEELRLLNTIKLETSEYKKIEGSIGNLTGAAKEQAQERLKSLDASIKENNAALDRSLLENEILTPLTQQTEAEREQLQTQLQVNKAVKAQQDFEAETAAITRKTTQDKVAASRALTKELDLIADKVANLEFTEVEGKLASIEARQRENEGRRIANGEMINRLELKRQLIKEGHLDVTQAEADKVETDLNVAYEETKQIEQERRDIGNEMVDVIDMQVDKMRDVKKATHDSKTAALEMKMALESIELKELKNQLDLAPQVDDFLDKLPELNDMMKDPSIPSHWKSFFAGMKADTKALAKDFAGLVQEGPDSVTTVKNRLKLLEKVQEKELKMMKDQQKLQELEQQHVIDMIALDIMRNEAIINGGLEELETQKQVLLTMGKKLDIAELLGELSQWEKERADEIRDSIEDQAEDIDGITKSRKKQAQEENKLLKSQMRQAEEKLKYLKMTGASNIEIKKQQQEVDRLKAKWREAKGEVGEYKDEIASGGKPGSRKRREETTGKNFKRLGSESRNMGQFVSSFVSHLTEKQLEMYKQGIALLKEEGKDINQMFREAAKNSNSISQRLAAGEAVPGLSTFSMNRKNQSELNAMRNLASQIAFQAAGAIRAQEQAARDAKRHADRDARIQENKLEHQRKVEAINARIAENTRVEAQEGIDLLSALLEETKQARIEAAQQALTALEESRAFAMSFIEKVAPADDATVFDLFRTLSPSEGDAGDTVQDQAAWEAVAAIFGEEAANKLSGLVTINKDFVDAFKEGTVKPEDLIQDNKVFLDPESGEIILTGKDPNFDKLQELVELVSLKKINQDQLDVLNQIAGNQLSYEDFENLGVVDEEGVIFGLGFGTEGAIPVDVVRGNETLAQTLERLNARYLKTLALQEDLDLATLEAGQSLKDLEPDALTWDELVDLSDREGYDNTLIKELAGNLAALAGAETKEAFDDGIKVDKAKIDVAQQELDIVSAPDLFADAAKFGYDAAALQDFVDKNPAKTQDIIDRLAAGKLTSVGALIETGVPKADAGTLANIETLLNKAVNRDDPVPESTGGKVTVPRGSGTYDATNDAIKNKKFDGDGTATLASLNNFLPQELRNADAKKKYFGSANNLHEITPEQLDAAITAINNPVSVDTGTGQSSNVQYVNPATGQVVSTNLNTSGGSYETFIPTTGNDTSSDTVGMLTQTGVGSIGLTPPPQGTFFGFNTLRAPAQPGESNGVIANNTQNSVLNGGNNAGNTNIQIINMNTNLNKGLSLAGTEGI